jgi:hypothetical protein
VTTPTSADVTLNGYDLYLEKDVPDHYEHDLADAQTFFSTQEAGPRVTHANLFHNLRYQYMSNWSNGEGSQSWGTDPDNDGYDQANLNPRIPGRLSLPPARADNDAGTLTTAGFFTTPIIAGVAFGTLFVLPTSSAVGNNKVYYSTDGTTWASWNEAAVSPVGAIASDGPHLYLWNFVSTNIERYHDTSGTKDYNAITGYGNGMHPIDMVATLGTLYAWTGHKLDGWDITNAAAFPIAFNAARHTLWKATDTASVNYPAHVQMIAADNTVVMMSSWPSDTRIYQWTPDPATPGSGSGQQLWKMPTGFTAWSIAFQAGLVLIAGEYENRAALFAMSLATLQTTFIGYVRPWASGVLVHCAPGPGSQVLLVHSSEGVFVYDYLTDATSWLDYHYSDRTNSADLTAVAGYGSVLTFKGNRYFFTPKKGSLTTVIEATKWQHDHTRNALGSTTVGNGTYLMIEPTWDFGFLSGAKVPIGLEFHMQPLGTNDRVQVDYLLEDNGAYGSFPASGANIGSGNWVNNVYTLDGSADTGKTYKYVDLTGLSVANFQKMRLRLSILKGDPIIEDVALKVAVPPGQETWTLILRLRDEYPGSAERPTNRQASASSIRSALWSAARAKTPVNFIDGFFYGANDKPQSDTYKVLIEDPKDTIEERGQGSMKVTLRRVDQNSLQ